MNIISSDDNNKGKTIVSNLVLPECVKISFARFHLDTQQSSDMYSQTDTKNHQQHFIIPEEKVLDAIFNEIRNKQASKKHVSVVEGVVIETTDEALNYC